jgi:ArsR family transcriptional regulator, arsenate/arsenite/antimonite-responsive transcriptional repressor
LIYMDMNGGLSQGIMKEQQSRSVQRLIDLGICRPSDIKRARNEAETLSSPEYAERIRRAERLLGVVGDSNRIKIILLLTKREMCVCELEAALDLPQPTVSHHLGLLEQAGLLERSKRARWVFYSVRESPVLDLVKGLVS